MKFNIKKFKSNISFFIICIVAITLLSLLSFFVDKKANKLEKVELSDKDININKLVINELMTSNKGTIPDGEGKLYDYIELYNGSEKDIDLKNYGLSDEAQVKWVFPDVTILKLGFLLVIIPSGNVYDLFPEPKNLFNTTAALAILLSNSSKNIISPYL